MKDADIKNKRIAQHLRNNMTIWENMLWYRFLKNHTIKFRRQQRICGYVVDFMCVKAKLILEIDGHGHLEDDAMAKDEERDKILLNFGYKVLRIPDRDINLNFDAVCLMINEELKQRLKDPSIITKVFGN